MQVHLSLTKEFEQAYAAIVDLALKSENGGVKVLAYLRTLDAHFQQGAQAALSATKEPTTHLDIAGTAVDPNAKGVAVIK